MGWPFSAGCELDGQRARVVGTHDGISRHHHTAERAVEPERAVVVADRVARGPGRRRIRCRTAGRGRGGRSSRPRPLRRRLEARRLPPSPPSVIATARTVAAESMSVEVVVEVAPAWWYTNTRHPLSTKKLKPACASPDAISTPSAEPTRCGQFGSEDEGPTAEIRGGSCRKARGARVQHPAVAHGGYDFRRGPRPMRGGPFKPLMTAPRGSTSWASASRHHVSTICFSRSGSSAARSLTSFQSESRW